MPPLPYHLLTGWDVVVVDDEYDSLDIAQIILESYGARVYTAINGRDGLALIKAVRPRFVISDLAMPLMDGWELMDKLKHDPTTAAIPVIALTAHAMIGDRERALAAGFYNHLNKPLTSRTFIQDLVSLLVEIPILAGELNF